MIDNTETDIALITILASDFINANSCFRETFRMFGVRLAEHQAEVKKVSEKNRLVPNRRASEQEQTKSAISDHVASANHVIDFENPKILGREHNKKSREIKEAMEIRK